MLDEALAAYAHFLSIFVTGAMLVAEAALYRPRMAAPTLALIRRLDLGYLLAAIAVMVTGLLRVFFYAKGADFYAANPVFWVKMALFATVGLLSVPPTLHFIRTGNATSGDTVVVAPELYRAMRRFITAELACFALIPLAATLMARGIG